MGDDSTTDSDKDSSLADEDVLSLHDEALSGRLEFEARQSWTGGVVEEPEQDPLVGATLHDTYRVTRVIGEGGMGRVYQAQHTRLASKSYALKVLHAEFARNPEIRSRFQHEAEAAARIEHACVAGTYDVGQTPQGDAYMVCEYLAGRDLNEYMQMHGPLPAQTVVHIGRQLCGALQAAHKKGIIHRDLKPHNVFVLSEDNSDDAIELPAVKLLDFGLSRFIERDNGLTKTGIILGTPSYMAPEQAGGLGTDHRTDIYGIGALMYAAATGRPPFKEDSPQQTVLSVLSKAPSRPRELVATIPTDLEIVIQRSMAREPDNRYQSAEAVDEALAQLEAPSVSGASKASRSRSSGSPRLALTLYALAGLAVGVPVVGLGALALLSARGIKLQTHEPSVLEWALLSVLTLLLLFPLGIIGRALRGTWQDSAQVAALLPRIKHPLIAGVLAYGITALAAFSRWGWQDHALSGTSALKWHFVLAANALLAASASVIWELTRKPSGEKSLAGVGYAMGASVAACVLLVSAALTTSSAAPPPQAEVVPSTKEKNQGSSAYQQPQPTEPKPNIAPTETASRVGAEQAEDNKIERAPTVDLARAKSAGASALGELAKEYPQDGEILKALVLAHASRADSLEQAVNAIAQLFATEPQFMNDADVLFILKKGLLGPAQVHAVAFQAVRKHMATSGGELIYELLAEHPNQHNRLKADFLALRESQKVRPATAVAYDLRYATSCRGRIDYLEAAEKEGDLRSVQQLRALSTAPKRCGWGRKCKPPCPAEAARFRATSNSIVRRLER